MKGFSRKSLYKLIMLVVADPHIRRELCRMITRPVRRGRAIRMCAKACLLLKEGKNDLRQD